MKTKHSETGRAHRVKYTPPAPVTGYENNLVLRVAAAREMGVSYGQYMAMLRDGAVPDPLARRE